MSEKFAICYIFHDTEAASHPVQIGGRFSRACPESTDGSFLPLAPRPKWGPLFSHSPRKDNALAQKGQKAALALKESLGQRICLALSARAIDAHRTNNARRLARLRVSAHDEHFVG